MARIEWVRHRLEEWSRWCMQRDTGGSGYPSQSAFARLGGKGSRAESVVPTISLQASETNTAVESLKYTQSHLYLAVTLTYAKCLPRNAVAKRMCRAESTVSRNLEDADIAIARWFNERKAQRDKIGQPKEKSCATYN